MCAKKIVEPSEILDGKRARNTGKTAHPSINPWYRFLARLLDYSVFIFLLSLLGKYVGFLSLLDTDNKYNYFSFFVFAAWIPIEAFLLSKWGKTLGKYILNISVEPLPHHRLDYSRAIKRSLLVWMRGFGMGFYMIAPFTMLYAYSKLKVGRQMSWDLQLRVNTHQKPVQRWRVILVSAIIAACIIWFIFL